MGNFKTGDRAWFTHVKQMAAFTGAGAIANDSIAVGTEADFILAKIMHTTSENVDAQTIVSGGAKIRIFDQSNQTILSDGPVPLDSISGRGQRPGIVPYSYRFKRGTTIGIELTNTGAANAVITLVFSGWREYA